MYYLIESTLREVGRDECLSGKSQYVVILTPEEWAQKKDDFEMGIDMEFDGSELYTTKAEVNYDSVTGTFSLPDRKNISGDYKDFAFALDEKGIVFIDPNDNALKIIRKVINTKKWRLPSLERFIYDFLEQIRDTYESRIEVRQNHIMTLLTVVTTIFMPLTLIAGWYGMNFKYMPELNWEIGYPLVFAVSVLIVILSLLFFKKKKWL